MYIRVVNWHVFIIRFLVLGNYTIEKITVKTEPDYEDSNVNYVVYPYNESPSVENKRWSVADTFALIAAYNKYRNQFVFAKKRKDVWEVITEFLNSNGISVSKCRF